MKDNDQAVASKVEARGAVQWGDLLRKYGLFVIIGVLVVVFTAFNSVFLSPNNLLNIVRQASVMIIFAMGVTFIIISGMMDLSVAGVACCTSMVGAIIMDRTGNVPLGIAAILLSGVLFGLFNGILVTKFQLNPFIVTLATANIASGATLLLTNGAAIYNLPRSFVQLGRGYVGPIPTQVIIMALTVVIAGIVLSKTVYGRRVYAIGGSKLVASLSGISINRYIVSFFVISSTCASLAGMILTARISTAQPLPSATMGMDVITSVVIGGTALSGGKGHVVGSMFGALMLTIISNGLTINSVSSYWQMVISALILVITMVMYRSS